MSIKLDIPSNHPILWHPLLLLPLIFPSIRVFSDESVLRIRWPKYWSFSFSISPFNEYSGLISFRMNWLDLLAVQGALKSLQHHSSKASILRLSAFFIVQLSHSYMTTVKTIALTRWTFVGKVMSLLFNMLSSLVTTRLLGLPWWLSGNKSTCNARDMGLITGSGRSSGRGNGNPLQYSCPGKSHRQRSLAGYSPWCYKIVGHDLVTKQQYQAFTKLQQAVFLCPNHPRAGTRQLEIASVLQSPLKLFKAANARPNCVSPISIETTVKTSARGLP